jgi:hypothetical protein
MENTDVDAGQDASSQEDHDRSHAGCEGLIEDNIASGSEDYSVNAEPDKFAIIEVIAKINRCIEGSVQAECTWTCPMSEYDSKCILTVGSDPTAPTTLVVRQSCLSREAQE